MAIKRRRNPQFLSLALSCQRHVKREGSVWPRPQARRDRHPRWSSPGYPCGPNALIAADFNGDGKLDLAVGSLRYACSGELSVLLGNGDGIFQSPVTYTAGGQSIGIVAADFNGDGKLDLAVADERFSGYSSPGSVAVLFGKGDGTFQSPITFAVGVQPSALSSGDFNGDGRVDLITSNSGGDTVTVLLSDGDGTFKRVDSSTGTAFPGFLTIGDFNGDGKMDAVVVTSYSNLIILLVYIPLGNGDCTFTSEVNTPLPATLYIGPVAVADLNGDGKADVIAYESTSSGQQLAVELGKGDGTFQNAITTSIGSATLSPMLTGDFNGDGKADVAGINGQSLSVLPGNGDGTFGA